MQLSMGLLPAVICMLDCYARTQIFQPLESWPVLLLIATKYTLVIIVSLFLQILTHQLPMTFLLNTTCSVHKLAKFCNRLSYTLQLEATKVCILIKSCYNWSCKESHPRWLWSLIFHSQWASRLVSHPFVTNWLHVQLLWNGLSHF